MRIANIDDRAAVAFGDEGSERAVDLAQASRGRFGPGLPAVYQAWTTSPDGWRNRTSTRSRGTASRSTGPSSGHPRRLPGRCSRSG